MKPSLETILHEAVNFEARAFDDDQHISGADLVEWFAQWRRRARAIVRANHPSHDAAIYVQRFRSQLISALHALQIVQYGAEVESPLADPLTHGAQYPLPTDAEIEALIHALDHGGVHVTAGQFTVRVFKDPAKVSSCQRR